MKKKNKGAGLLFLVISLLCIETSVIAGRKSNIDTFVGGACIAAFGLLGVAGIAKFAQWCFSETDEQMIARVNWEYNQGLVYKDMIFCMQQIGSDAEFITYSLAAKMWEMGQSQSSYRSQLHKATNALQLSLPMLYARINALQNVGPRLSYDKKRKMTYMHSLAEKIEQLLPNLVSLSDYLDLNKTYFSLYEVEGKLMDRYSEQLSIWRTASHWSDREYNIKQSVIYADSGCYPFVNFVDRLESDISLLRKTISSVVYNYTKRLGCARELLDILVGVKNIIVSDMRYAQERHVLELERLERERVAAYQAQARAQEKQAQAQEKQARAQQDMANAMYQQNLLLALQKNEPQRDTIIVNVNV